MGNATQVKDKEILKTLKITHVLNTAEEVEICKEELSKAIPMDFFCNHIFLDSIGVQYSKLPIKDFQDFDISEFFQEAYKNISDIIKEDPKNNILVHCARGMSRSVAIVAMYLMKKNKWSYRKVNII